MNTSTPMSQLRLFIEKMREAAVIRKALSSTHGDITDYHMLGSKMKNLLAADLGMEKVEKRLQEELKPVMPDEVEMAFFIWEEPPTPISAIPDPVTPDQRFELMLYCYQEIGRINTIKRPPYQIKALRIEREASRLRDEFMPKFGKLEWDYYVNPALAKVIHAGYQIISKEVSFEFEFVPVNFLGGLGGLDDLFSTMEEARMSTLDKIMHGDITDTPLYHHLKDFRTSHSLFQEGSPTFLRFRSGPNAGHFFDPDVKPMDRSTEEKNITPNKSRIDNENNPQ